MVRAMQYRMFWRDLAVMLNAGLPLLRALNVVVYQKSLDDFFDLGIRIVAESIQGGSTFAEAMADSSLFSQIEIDLIHAGEVGGILETVISRLGDGKMFTRADQYVVFYASFGTMISAGVPILRALKLSSEQLDNSLKLAVMKIHDSIKVGGTIVDPMEASGEFSPLEINLIDVAEETGTLDFVLMKLVEMSQPIAE